MQNQYLPPSPYSGAQVITTNGPSPAPSAQLSPPPPQNPSYPLPPPLQPPVTSIVRIPSFGPYPVQLNCPYCHNNVTTETAHSAGAMPWIVFSVCLISGFLLLIPWFFCWVPFCIDSLMDVKHTCPSCKRDVGRFSRI
uniref:LITAF domain-containing protein n=1 Tax=Acrobeloides nanus TaxID=290746 RepID=A0A914CIH3_9BILA